MTHFFRSILFFSFALSISAIPTSCNEPEPDVIESGNDYVHFAPISRGEYNERTFAAHAISNYTEYAYLGTYCEKKDHEWLTPCEVDENGVWLRDDNNYGMKIYDGGYSYILTLSTPAVGPITYQSRSYGYFQSRLPNQPRETVKFSDGYNVSGAGSFFGGQYIYVIPDGHPLYEHRSRLRFVIKCGEDIDRATFRSLSLSNIMSSAYYDIIKDEYCNATIGSETIWAGDVTLTSGTSQIAGDDFSMLSQRYSKQDENMQYVYERPLLRLEMDNKVFSESLNFDMVGQCLYTITLTVNSVYVTANVSVSQWNDGGNINDEINTSDIATFIMSPIGWSDKGENNVIIQ